jgi:hypothetical protein
MPNPKHSGPKSIPNQVQLSGGVILKAMPFKIVAYNDDDSPKLFELQPADPRGVKAEADAYAGECVLFAREELLRNPWPKKTNA